jgi:glyoxylase-like metal-dependent hydrolase (beta-lactamase superfamily II)
MSGVTSRLRKISPGVWVATSRRYSTTSTVLLDGRGGAVVIDPAWDPDELAAIPADLAGMGIRCVAGLATHEHYDHVMWHPDLGEVPRWATPGTVAHLAEERDRLLAPLAQYLTPDLIEIAGRLDPIPAGHLPWDGPVTRCVVHDAHAPAHLALLMEESGVLVAGDMLSDVELPMPAADDTTLERYVTGLERLGDSVRQARIVIPGHGTPSTDPLARFDADRRYLDDLIGGRASDDPRIADPENASLHAANLERARLTR